MLLFLSSCTVFTHVPKDKQLVTKVKIKGAPAHYREQLNELVVEKTNTKIFGVWRVRTRNWYVSEKWRTKRGKEENTIWEAPSYYTKEGTEATVKRIESFLKNNGYFNTQVTAQVKFYGLRNKKAEVTFKVKKKKPYFIKEVSRNIEDFDIYQLIEKDKKNSLIGSGKVFSSNNLINERERLMFLLRQNGYYDFSREYIYFDLDSSIGNHKINVRIGLKNPGNYDRHNVYVLNSVTFTEKAGLASDTQSVELAHNIFRKGTGNAYIDELLLRSLNFKPGEIYNEVSVQESFKNLRKLKHYQYVDVQFLKETTGSDTLSLNLIISLSPLTRYQTQVQSEVITSEQNGAGLSFNGRLYGIAGSFTFQDLNFLKRGIQMDLKLGTSTEIGVANYPKILSNNELSLSNNYYFAKPFLSGIIPINLRNAIDQSTLSLNGFLENNPDFSRRTANISAGYLIESGRFKHYVLPLDFNMISTHEVCCYWCR